VTDEVLSQPRLNRALLARQLLLERARLTIPEALERLAGIQNQYAPNAYLRLWSCLEGFQRDDLTHAYETNSVVQGTLMRGTIHTVSAADHGPFVDAIREPMRAWAGRVYRDDDGGRDALVARVRAALAGRTASRTELHALRGDAANSTWATIDLDAGLLRVAPSGTWGRRRADIFGLAEDRIAAAERLHTDDPLEHLVRRYLTGFGPASARDVSLFTGVPATALKPVLEAMKLRTFRDEASRRLIDVPEGVLPDPETPAPVRFLPTWDATLLVHARRTLILPEAYRPLIFHTKMPPSYPTFLVDGQVAGTWRFEEGRISLAPFRELLPGERREVDEEAARLAEFHSG